MSRIHFTAKGRPLAFLAMIFVGWAGLRLLYLAMSSDDVAGQGTSSVPVDRSVSAQKQAGLIRAKERAPTSRAQESTVAARTD